VLQTLEARTVLTIRYECASSAENLILHCIESPHDSQLSLQPSPQYDIHPAQLRRCIHVRVDMYTRPVVRNEKGSRRRHATCIMCILFKAHPCTRIAVSPPAEEKGKTNKFRVCTLSGDQGELISWSCARLFGAWIGSQALGLSFKQPGGNALERGKTSFWNSGPLGWIYSTCRYSSKDQALLNPA
jgi:hypothetical protein